MKKQFLSFLLLLPFALTAYGQNKEAQKFDEYGPGVSCEDYLSRADAMIITQGNNPSSKIYVFVYEGKERQSIYKNGEYVDYKLVFPQYGSAKAKIYSIKKYLTGRKIPLENYVFVNGGFRETSRVEIWLVPKGAEPPKPTPTLKKVKYRKGKPNGFCLGCC